MDTSEQLVSLIRDLIKEEISKKDASEICQISSVNQNGTLNIILLSDPDTIIPNIKNTSQYEFESGDYGVLYKIENKLNNSFIFSKILTIPSITNEEVKVDDGDYVVKNVTGVEYGFEFDAETGYYVSQNKDFKTYSLCKIVFSRNIEQISMKGISLGDSLSYGVVGYKNQVLSKSIEADPGAFSFKSTTQPEQKQIIFTNIKSGDFVMCKYINYYRTQENNFRFKILPYLEVKDEHGNNVEFETQKSELIMVQ